MDKTVTCDCCGKKTNLRDALTDKYLFCPSGGGCNWCACSECQTACAPQAPPSLAHAALARVERRLARQLAPAEERSLLAALMEALLPLPLPAGGGGSRLRLLTGRSFLRALEEPALAQLWASLLEVLRATEGLPTPTTTRLLEQLVAATGAVGGLGASAMLV